MMRVQRYLAQCGVASRRQSERYVEEGRVGINGQTAKLGDSVDPECDLVTFDGRPVATDRKMYLVLNKPRGVITSSRDTHERRTVLDCLPDLGCRVFPVGRLDQDVEGVLLLTNDGELAYRLTHPSFEIEKVYHAWVDGRFGETERTRLEAGVELDDGPSAPARVVVLQAADRASLVQLGIHEGRKREVKRMCAAVGHPVRRLRRIEIAGVRADGLEPGEWRFLKAEEISGLLRMAGLHGA